MIMALQAQQAAATVAVDAYIAPLGAGMNRHALKLARELRDAGLVVDVGDESFRLKKGFEAAEKMSARFVIIVGENEVKADSFAVKDIKKGEQVTVPRADLAAALHKQ
jgi:histidyl-tRNA synthetase